MKTADFIVASMFVLMPIITIGSIAYMIIYAIDENRHWREFATEHHCVIVETIPAYNQQVTTFGPNGTPSFGFITIPERNAWKCDDERIYWR